MHSIAMINLPRLHNHTPNLQSAINKVVESGMYINGPEINLFTSLLTQQTDNTYFTPCANGTDALQIALKSLDLPAGSEVIVPSFNYIAAVEMIAAVNLRPVFVDIEESTFNIDPIKTEQLITSKTKAIIPVNLFGQSANLEKIRAIADQHHLKIIEDNAQSLGTSWNGKQSGYYSDLCTTSFFPTKNLGCMGDGGGIFTNDETLAKRCKMIASHGQSKKYTFDLIGQNSRLDTIQAAVLIAKLGQFDETIKNRKVLAEYYDHRFKVISKIKTPLTVPESNHTYNQYTIQLPDENTRDHLKNHLNGIGISSMIYYPKPIHLQEAYRYLNYKSGDFPISEALCKTVLSLPMDPYLSDLERHTIATSVEAFFK